MQHRSDQLGRQRRLDGAAHASAGPTMAASSSAADMAAMGTVLLAMADREPLEAQGPVVEVGPQGCHHPEPAGRNGHRVDQTVEEGPLLTLVRQREQLLELVHHEQQVSPAGTTRRMT